MLILLHRRIMEWQWYYLWVFPWEYTGYPALPVSSNNNVRAKIYLFFPVQGHTPLWLAINSHRKDKVTRFFLHGYIRFFTHSLRKRPDLLSATGLYRVFFVCPVCQLCLPSVVLLALGKFEFLPSFFILPSVSLVTLSKNIVGWVPDGMHSANNWFLVVTYHSRKSQCNVSCV